MYIAVGLVALPLAAATVNVRVTNASGAAIENAVVYAIPSQPVPVGRKVAVMDQINRAFVPHVLPIQTGTWVEFPNSDQILHHVFSVSPTKQFQTPLYVGKPPRPIQFPKTGVAELGCTIHEEMNGFIVVVDTPYFATTTKAGRVSIADVAAGDYMLRVWYRGMRSEPPPQTLNIRGDSEVTATIVASAK
jgi:plastocyanin